MAFDVQPPQAGHPALPDNLPGGYLLRTDRVRAEMRALEISEQELASLSDLPPRLVLEMLASGRTSGLYIHKLGLGFRRAWLARDPDRPVRINRRFLAEKIR